MTNITTIYPLKRGPLVGIALTSDGKSLLAVKFLTSTGEREQLMRQLAPVRADHELHQRAHAQLDGYFAGELRKFNLPLRLDGTEFQRKVWQEIAAISFGQVFSYGQVAAKLGGSGLPRAVGQAANKNSDSPDCTLPSVGRGRGQADRFCQRCGAEVVSAQPRAGRQPMVVISVERKKPIGRWLPG